MKPLPVTVLAVVLGVVAVAAAEKAQRYQTGAQWLVVVVLGVCTAVAVVAACTAVAGVAWFGIKGALYERRLAARIVLPPSLAARQQPLPEVSLETLARDVWIVNEYADDYSVEARHARREAEQAASSPRDGFTQPLPTLDDTVTLAAVHTAPWDDWFRTAAGVGSRS